MQKVASLLDNVQQKVVIEEAEQKADDQVKVRRKVDVQRGELQNLVAHRDDFPVFTLNFIFKKKVVKGVEKNLPDDEQRLKM